MPLHKSVVSKFLKAGATIEQTEHRGGITWYIATYGERFVAWYTEEGRARCLHTPSPSTDIITDCFCDTYYYTINDAVYSLVGHDKYQELKAKKEVKP